MRFISTFGIQELGERDISSAPLLPRSRLGDVYAQVLNIFLFLSNIEQQKGIIEGDPIKLRE